MQCVVVCLYYSLVLHEPATCQHLGPEAMHGYLTDYTFKSILVEKKLTRQGFKALCDVHFPPVCISLLG